MGRKVVMEEFDWTEKASWIDDCECRFKGDQADASECERHGATALPISDAGDSHCEPDPCPVRHSIFVHAQTVGQMMDALKLHRLEYCEECGQMEGFVRERKAA